MTTVGAQTERRGRIKDKKDYSQEPAFTRWGRAYGLEPTEFWAVPFHWFDGYVVLERAITVVAKRCDQNVP